MVSPAVRDVVLVRFPFSDLSTSKLRPAIVLAEAGRGDWVLCQVTSNPYSDSRAIEIKAVDFQAGTLPCTSYARPGKIFTANASLMERIAGKLVFAKQAEVVAAVISILRPTT